MPTLYFCHLTCINGSGANNTAVPLLENSNASMAALSTRSGSVHERLRTPETNLGTNRDYQNSFRTASTNKEWVAVMNEGRIFFRNTKTGKLVYDPFSEEGPPLPRLPGGGEFSSRTSSIAMAAAAAIPVIMAGLQAKLQAMGARNGLTAPTCCFSRSKLPQGMCPS